MLGRNRTVLTGGRRWRFAVREVVSRCDKCGETPAESFTVIYGSDRWLVDLCERHGKPILDLRKVAQVEPESSGRRSATQRSLDARVRNLPRKANGGDA